MDNLDLIRRSLAEITGRIAPALLDLGAKCVESAALEEYLARLSFHVAPSYAPLATDDSGVYVLVVWPDREIWTAPVAYVPHDEQEAKFVCASLRTFPSAMWLRASVRLSEKLELLRQATDTLAANIPGGIPVREELWNFSQDMPTRWYLNKPRHNEAWHLAGGGHPFAGISNIRFSTEVAEALPIMEQFVKERSNEPEVVAAYLGTLAMAKLALPREKILQVLGAEAWRNLGCMVDGLWRAMGRGICEWDCTLKNTEDPKATFSGTPFEPLIGHPNTYSGEDREGPKRLLAVADNFHKAGDAAGELRQTRNAATLAILTAGEYPLDFAERIATVCDAISKDSLAAAIARESARVHSQGP